MPVMRALLTFLKDETAASAIEYGLFSGLLAAVLMGTIAIGTRLTSG